MKIEFNEEKAVQTGNDTLITEGGLYTVKIEKAKHIYAQSGAEGIEFTFSCIHTGKKAISTLFFLSKTKEEISFSYNLLQALMGLLGLSVINSEMDTAEEYDKDAKKVMLKRVPLYKTLMNRTVTVLLQREEYRKARGGIGVQYNIKNFYNIDKQTYKEFKNNLEAEQWEKDLKRLKDISIEDKEGKSESFTMPKQSVQQGGYEDEDEIPF